MRRAWDMKADGARNWQVHKELNVFDAINSYTIFSTIARPRGYVKCDALLIPDAHPAYVEPAEFERIQSLRRTRPFNRRAENGDPQHSKRHQRTRGRWYSILSRVAFVVPMANRAIYEGQTYSQCNGETLCSLGITL